MRSWSPAGECPRLADLASLPDFASGVCELARRIRAAQDTDDVVELLGAAVDQIGLDAAAFVSLVRDCEQAPVVRVLLAGDPLWASGTGNDNAFADDPWLAHALASTDVVRASEIEAATPAQHRFVDAAALSGYKSATIVPAPSAQGAARIGVLYLGSSQPGFFDDECLPLLAVLARGLAMELHDWWRRHLRAELLAQCRLTAADLELLRHECDGHCSKVIAVALGTEAKTIDCRFQRLNAKLGVQSRREAARLARLYGLV